MDQPPAGPQEPPEVWAAWAAAFAAGEFVDPAVPIGTGERVALRLNDAVVAQSWPANPPGVTQILYRGPLVITDRRILAAGGVTQWSWSDGISRVIVQFNGWGVSATPTRAAILKGRLGWDILNPAVLNREPQEPAELDVLRPAWNRILAAWRASEPGLQASGEGPPPPPLNPKNLPLGQRPIAKELIKLRQTFASGGLSKRGLGQPVDYAADERLLVAVPFVARGSVFGPAEPPELVHCEYLVRPDKLLMNHVEGKLFVTDRRAVLVGNRRKVVSQWWWRDLVDVRMLRNFAGIHFITPTSDVGSEAALYVDRPWLKWQPSHRKVATWLLSAIGAYVLSSGKDYDAWLAEVPRKWLD